MTDLDWNAIGAIGEILGAFGVIITVAYLAIQVRNNTKALHATSFQHESQEFNRINMSVAENPELAKTITKAFSDPAALEEHEMFQVSTFLLANFHVLETLFYGYKNGTVPEVLWKAEENGLKNMINQEIVLRWWETIRIVGPFTEDFRDHIETLIGTSNESERWNDLLNLPDKETDRS